MGAGHLRRRGGPVDRDPRRPCHVPARQPHPRLEHRVDHAELRPLHGSGPGDTVVLERLTEDLELELDVMRYFEEHGLMPRGVSIRVAAVAPDGTMSLNYSDDRTVLLQLLRRQRRTGCADAPGDRDPAAPLTGFRCGA